MDLLHTQLHMHTQFTTNLLFADCRRKALYVRHLNTIRYDDLQILTCDKNLTSSYSLVYSTRAQDSEINQQPAGDPATLQP